MHLKSWGWVSTTFHENLSKCRHYTNKKYFYVGIAKAEHGYLPQIFKTRSKYGTPTAGIVFNTIIIILFSCADFGQLLQLLNSVYAMALLMEYAAFVKLRLFHKECKLFCRLFFTLYPKKLEPNLSMVLTCSTKTVSHSSTRLGCSHARNPSNDRNFLCFCHIKLVCLCLLRWGTVLGLLGFEGFKKSRMGE